MVVSDELDFGSYQADPSLLDRYLKKMDFAGGAFWTFAKYADLQDTWTKYYTHLKDHFGFALSPGDIVFDIGAHHGIVAVNCARLGARVFAYEPHPVNFAVLQRNIALVGTPLIEAWNKAVFSKSGSVIFNFGKTLTTGALVDAGRDWKRTLNNYSVEAVSLEDMVCSHGRIKIKLMKIDCEGSEYEFLMKAPQEVVRRVDYFYIEAHPTRFYDPPDLSGFLEGNGYEVIAMEAAHGCFDFACRRQ